MTDCKRSFFQLDENITYLNCAYMSPLMKAVEEAGKKGTELKRNPHLIRHKEFFEAGDNLRREFSKLVHARAPERIAIIPSVSYGISTVTNNMPAEKGDTIIVADEQFPSNIYPWMRLCETTGAELKIVEAPKMPEDRGKKWNERILNAINSKTKAVALGHIHWADGTLFNLSTIRKRTREVGALLIIDGTQSVGALPFDVHQFLPDALICAGYKWLMGPYSTGLAYYGPAFDDGIPIEENWINRYKSEDFANLVNYSTDYQPGALRYDVGERSNFILVPMMLKALEILNDWGVQNIQQYCKNLSEENITRLKELGYQVEDEEHRSAHLFGIRAGKHHNIQEIQKRLNERNIVVSFRGDAIRVSPNVYNTKEELHKLVEALTE